MTKEEALQKGKDLLKRLRKANKDTGDKIKEKLGIKKDAGKQKP